MHGFAEGRGGHAADCPRQGGIRHRLGGAGRLRDRVGGRLRARVRPAVSAHPLRGMHFVGKGAVAQSASAETFDRCLRAQLRSCTTPFPFCAQRQGAQHHHLRVPQRPEPPAPGVEQARPAVHGHAAHGLAQGGHPGHQVGARMGGGMGWRGARLRVILDVRWSQGSRAGWGCGGIAGLACVDHPRSTTTQQSSALPSQDISLDPSVTAQRSPSPLTPVALPAPQEHTSARASNLK